MCGKRKVNSWKEDIMITEHGEEILLDTYEGKVEMKTVDEKIYLGQIISKDLMNGEKNLKDKINRLVGNGNQIISTFNQTPYGNSHLKQQC